MARGHDHPEVVVAQWARANQEACRKILKKHRKKGRQNAADSEEVVESGRAHWGRGFDDAEYERLQQEAFATLDESYQAALKASGQSTEAPRSAVLRALGLFLFLAGVVILALALAKDASAGRTLLALSVAGGLLLAWGNGANDAANSMGGAVGAEALTLRQAVIGGALAELAGSALMGVHVSKTISKGVIQANDYQGQSDEFAFLFFAVTVGAASTTIAATYYRLPISATHGIIGGLIGCGALARGGGSLGLAAILRTCASWVLSPALGGVITGLLHSIVYFSVFRNAESEAATAHRSRKLQPFFSALAAFIVALFLLLKGPKELYFWKKDTYGIPFVTALGISVVAGACNLFWARRTRTTGEEMGGSGARENELCEVDTTSNPRASFASDPRVSFASNKSIRSETTHTVTEVDAMAAAKGGLQLTETERPFRLLLVVTSLCVAFAHGANDVGNSAGPFAAVLEGVAGRVVSTPDVPIWVVIAAGACMGLGILTWGERTIGTVSNKITALSPSKAFSVQLGAAVAVLTASILELPVSTSHCLVGAVIGSGLADKALGLPGSIDWKMLGKIGISWLLTIPLAMAIACAIFAAGRGAFTN